MKPGVELDLVFLCVLGGEKSGLDDPIKRRQVSDEIGNGGGAENIPFGSARTSQHGREVMRSRGIALAARVRMAVDRGNNLGNRNRRSITRELISSDRASVAVDQSRRLQFEQDFRQIGLGDPLRNGNVSHLLGESITSGIRQFSNGQTCIFRLRGDPHRAQNQILLT
jgi:hypothetical protein